MKKILILLILIIISISVFSEPYRPYPIIAIHGYNTNNYKESNFGIVMDRDHYQENIDYPIASSPVKIDGEGGLWYVSRNEGKRIEYGKLLYKCAEYNSEILNYWHIRDSVFGGDSIYWIKNDNEKYSKIPSTDEILPEDEDDKSVSQPINCFIETMEFDFPKDGSSDEQQIDGIEPTAYQVGRGRELLYKRLL